jgi:hypothetical protein
MLVSLADKLEYCIDRSTDRGKIEVQERERERERERESSYCARVEYTI